MNRVAAPGLPYTRRADDLVFGRRRESVLRSVLLEASSTGASTIHVEPADDAWRVRIRRANGLASRRIGKDTGLDKTLARLTRRKLPAAIMAPSGRTRIHVKEIDTFQGNSWSIQITPAPIVLPTLDELISDHPSRQHLQQELAQHSGVIVLAGSDLQSTALIRAAIAQHCIAPDRRVVRLENSSECHPPGCIGCTPEPDGVLDPSQLPELDADVLIIGNTDLGLSDVMESARQISRSRLVVLQCIAHDLPGTLTLLKEMDPQGTWLPLRSVTIVQHYELAILCNACKLPVSDTADLSTTTAINTWLESLIHPACDAPGCDSCYHSGTETTRQVIDVLIVDEALKESWRLGDFYSVQEKLERQRRVPHLANRWVRAGVISESEARRTHSITTAGVQSDSP